LLAFDEYAEWILDILVFPFHLPIKLRNRIMTQSQLDRAVAHATGESMRTIHALGFIPLAGIVVEREPLVVDWDELDAQRYSVFPQRRRETVQA
jgi:hypothetical protein